MLDKTLAEIEAADAFFKSLQWPRFRKNPAEAARVANKLSHYLAENWLTLDYIEDIKKALLACDKKGYAYDYCKESIDDLQVDFTDLMACFEGFDKYKETSPKKTKSHYGIVVAQFNELYESHTDLRDAVNEYNQLLRINNALSAVVKSYRKDMDTMRSRGRLLMERPERDKNVCYPRQIGSDKHGFFQLAAKTDPTSQHRELLEEVYNASHPVEKIAAIEYYILDPNAKGSFYQQSFKMKLVQAINNELFVKDVEGAKPIKGNMSPDKVREIFSKNAIDWHVHHFPNYELPLEVKGPQGTMK